METKQIKPSGWWYVVALAVLLFACVAAAALFPLGIAGTVNSAIGVDRLINSFDRVTMPGSAELTLDETGSYVVFAEPFDLSSRLPQLNCELKEKASGREVPLFDAWLQQGPTYQTMDRAGTLLMRFDVDSPSTYVLTCQYAGGGDTPKVVLAVGTNFWSSVVDVVAVTLASLFLPVLLCFGAGILALVILVVVAVMRHQSARRLQAAASQSPS